MASRIATGLCSLPVVFILIWSCVDAVAQDLVETQLFAGDVTQNDWFGWSVDLSGEFAIVGAIDDEIAENAGAAYIFKRSGTEWIQTAKLTASDAAEGDQFGFAVSIEGDYAIVGAIYDDNEAGEDAGGAYVFHRVGESWIEETKLMPHDGGAYDVFGVSVSLSGSFAIVGSSGNDDNGAQSGAAYIFEHDSSGWVEAALLTPSDGAENDHFGGRVVINEDLAIVGARRDNALTGAAYIFRREENSSWIEEAKLTASDGEIDDDFGHAVALGDSMAAVGVPKDDHIEGIDAGSVYVFIYGENGWEEQTRLTASDVEGSDWFGYSVDVRDDMLVVGSRFDDNLGGVDVGSAYMFENANGNWGETEKLVASDAFDFDSFGFSVALGEHGALVGSILSDVAASNGGAAYLYGELSVAVVAATLTSKSDPIEIPPGGGSFDYKIGFVNNTDTSQNVDFWTVAQPVGGPAGPPIVGPKNKTFPAHASLSRGLTQFLPNSSPGDFYYILFIGSYPDTIISSDTLDILKLAVQGAEAAQSNSSVLPDSPVLYKNYPNPFNPSTTIRFYLPSSSEVNLSVYDIKGRLVKKLVDGQMAPGSHRVQWDGTNGAREQVASGIYLYRITAGEFTQTRRMLLLR